MILGSSDSDEKVAALVPPAYVISSTDPSFSFRKYIVHAYHVSNSYMLFFPI